MWGAARAGAARAGGARGGAEGGVAAGAADASPANAISPSVTGLAPAGFRASAGVMSGATLHSTIWPDPLPLTTAAVSMRVLSRHVMRCGGGDGHTATGTRSDIGRIAAQAPSRGDGYGGAHAEARRHSRVRSVPLWRGKGSEDECMRQGISAGACVQCEAKARMCLAKVARRRSLEPTGDIRERLKGQCGVAMLLPPGVGSTPEARPTRVVGPGRAAPELSLLAGACL